MKVQPKRLTLYRYKTRLREPPKLQSIPALALGSQVYVPLRVIDKWVRKLIRGTPAAAAQALAKDLALDIAAIERDLRRHKERLAALPGARS